MATLLLDHPWPFEQALNRNSALKRFNDWIRQNPDFDPVPFLDRAEYDKVLEQMHRTSYDAFIARFAFDYVKDESEGPVCTIAQGPDDLPVAWMRSLAAAVARGDWRIPQIIALEERRNRWPNTAEVETKIGEGTNERVLAILEHYEDHRFAIPDFDPWDLRKYDRDPLDGRNPCRLPKPPDIDISSTTALRDTVEKARRAGWRTTASYYYIPPQTWVPETISKAQWRNGRAFPQQQGPGFKGPRVIDYDYRTWVWDHTETQWDVQEGRSFYRISEKGTLLPRSPLR